MGNVDGRRTPSVYGLLNRCQHLDLRGHIKRRGRFIKNHDLRLTPHSHRRHCALQLPAGNLMRITLAEMIWIRQFQLPEQFPTPLIGFAGIHSAVLNRRLGKLVNQTMGRIECGGCTLGNV